MLKIIGSLCLILFVCFGPILLCRILGVKEHKTARSRKTAQPSFQNRVRRNQTSAFDFFIMEQQANQQNQLNNNCCNDDKK